MTGLHELAPAHRSRRKPAKRVGRGNAARRGNFCGRGIKGQKARESIAPLFEGGQLPLIKRLPSMRGFKNRSRVPYQAVNLKSLAVFRAGTVVAPEQLLEKRIVRHLRLPIKILGDGKLEKKLKIVAHAFSASARSSIEAGGGTCEQISAETPKDS